MTAYVYHLIHVSTPYRYIPKLFITNVPAHTTKEELRGLISGRYSFGEFGVPWANHRIGFGLKEADPEVQRGWREGEVERIDFKEFLFKLWSFHICSDGSKEATIT